MVRQKAELVRRLGLGGGMVWALDLDDFKNHCGEGVHPLLTELQSVLADPICDSDQQPDPIAIQLAKLLLIKDMMFQSYQNISIGFL